MPAHLEIDSSELVKLLQLKSKEAFSILYDNYSAALYGTICRLIGNNTAAEDLLQDVFVKIWKKIDTYDAGKGTFFTWMLNITRHVCIDHLRSKQHKQEMKTVENGFEYKKIILEAKEANTKYLTGELHKVTQKLEVKHRQVIELIYFLGYTQEETARLLNIPVGTVKTRSRAALKQLRYLYT